MEDERQMPKRPRRSGASICHQDHGYITPPQEREGHEKGCQGGDEDEGAEVVDFEELFDEGSFLEGEFQEEDYACKADGYDGDVKPEYPSPGIAVGEDTANQWS